MNKPRARDLGWITSTLLNPGEHNTITDVPGVLVGHSTLIFGEPGPLKEDVGPVRTGVTSIRPHAGNLYTNKVTAGVHILNAYGKTTGTEQIREMGVIETPILLTNTLNVWRVADALLDWMLEINPNIGIITHGTISLVVGECYDGFLNDTRGRHAGRESVFAALNNATPEPVTEGNVGAGTGTRSYEFKAGIGSASRVLPEELGGFNVGVLVQANFGLRKQLVIRGLPIGKWLQDWPAEVPSTEPNPPDGGSCMIIVATDAPLSSRQLTRLARRAPLGMARTGTVSGPSSGDFVIAFSTTQHRSQWPSKTTQSVERLNDEWACFGNLSQAVVESTEEAVLNSLAAAETMVGRDGNIASAIPIDIVQEMLQTVLEIE